MELLDLGFPTIIAEAIECPGDKSVRENLTGNVSNIKIDFVDIKSQND